MEIEDTTPRTMVSYDDVPALGILDTQVSGYATQAAYNDSSALNARAAHWTAAAATLVFLMAMVVSLFLANRASLPQGLAFFAIGVLALGVALSFAFLGGDAAAKGSLPVPLVKDHPVQFSVVGGVAVFVIVFLLATVAWRQLVP